MNNIINIQNRFYKVCSYKIIESDSKAEKGDLFVNGMFNLVLSDSDKPNRNYNSQHIYILSDDEIKTDNWCIDNEGIVRKCIGINNGRLILEGINNLTVLPINYKKVIATTNKNLDYYSQREVNGFSGDMPLPKPPIEFIQQVINGSITTSDKILVEYEEFYFHGAGYYRKEELSKEEQERYSFMKEFLIKISEENTVHVDNYGKKSNSILLSKIKQQFEARKQDHLESAKYQPEKIDSKWSANNTASLVDLLYLTVEEIINEQ